MLSDCLHSLAALDTSGMLALSGAMLLAGLAGGVTHCAGMCGPFVIAQTLQDGPSGRLARLSGLHLLPYQLGRATGYATLGAVAGGAVGLASLGLSRSLLAVPLLLAALLMLNQAASALPLPPRLRIHLPQLPVPGVLARLLRDGAPGPARRFVLGLLLSALPCGLLYAALAAAAASGSALAGAIAMLAFVAGTVPALTAVALLGRFFGRRCGPGLRVLGGIALLLNAAVLVALATRVA